MLNDSQKQLLSVLSEAPSEHVATKALKRTLEQFVVEYGWWYEPSPLPEGGAMGEKNQCHKNAATAVLNHEELVYCEGFVAFRSGSHPILHSWVTDGTGRAFDNTLSVPGVAYAGVPFKTSFVTVTNLRNQASISMLDDWVNGYPLRSELGDKPEDWLEIAGKGTSKLNADQQKTHES